jgi:hypothetical protein
MRAMAISFLPPWTWSRRLSAPRPSTPVPRRPHR